MNVKKIIIPTITMVIIASSLMGCAAASQDELLNMVHNGEQIEIEVATPKDEFQGTEVTYDWTRLDQLKTQPELRKAIDDFMLITTFGENSKNGILYINLDGNQEGNNTLYNVFANNTFRLNYWDNEEASTKLAEFAAVLCR